MLSCNIPYITVIKNTDLNLQNNCRKTVHTQWFICSFDQGTRSLLEARIFLTTLHYATQSDHLGLNNGRDYIPYFEDFFSVFIDLSPVQIDQRFSALIRAFCSSSNNPNLGLKSPQKPITFLEINSALYRLPIRAWALPKPTYVRLNYTDPTADNKTQKQAQNTA